MYTAHIIQIKCVVLVVSTTVLTSQRVLTLLSYWGPGAVGTLDDTLAGHGRCLGLASNRCPTTVATGPLLGGVWLGTAVGWVKFSYPAGIYGCPVPSVGNLSIYHVFRMMGERLSHQGTHSFSFAYLL